MPKEIRPGQTTERRRETGPPIGVRELGAPTVSTRKRKKKGGSGFWHSIAEPFVNTGKTIYGIGPGLATAGAAVGRDVADIARTIPQHPERALVIPAIYSVAIDAALHRKNPAPRTYKKVIEPTGKAYAYKYGSGDLTTTLSRALKEDPVGTIADVATVASLGVGSAAKVGLLAKAPRSIELRGPGVLAGQAGKTVEKGIAGTELSRRVRIGTDRLLKNLPPDFPVLGEVARFGKAIKVRQARPMLANRLKSRPYLKSERALSKDERVAANLIHDYPTRPLLDEYRASLAGQPEAGPTLELLNDPKVLAKFDNPSPKMLTYLDESAKLGDISTGLAGLAPETAEARRFQQALLLRGAQIAREPFTHVGDRALGRTAVLDGREGTVIKLEGDTATLRFQSDKGSYTKEASLAKLESPDFSLQPAPGTTIPQMIEGIRSELGDRPEPLYRKHVSAEEVRGTTVGAGGGAPQPLGPPIKQSRAILAAMGRVAYDIDSLTPAYLKNVKWATYTDRHADLVASGVEVNRGYRLAEGEEFLKRTPGEKIPYTEKTAGEFERNLTGDLGDHLATKLPDEAFETATGTRIVIPTALKKRVVGEYSKSLKAVDWFFKKPTNVWRALVLNLRVGWLVNNIVGNTLLYTVKSAGVGGLRAYLGAISDLHGVRAALRLVDDPQITKHITPVDMAELLPEQTQAFMLSQVPAAGKFGQSRVGRTLTAVPRVLRSVDIAYEQALRRAIANRVLRRSPEARAIYKAMPKQTRSWRAAMRQTLKDPKVADRVSAEINNSLGDFSNLAPLEQAVLRQAAPFYAWYRAITLITLKMPLDSPVRTSILYNLGKVGAQEPNPYGYPFPGAIAAGDNTIIKTAGLQPYATVPSVGKDLKTLGQAFVGSSIPGAGIDRVNPRDLTFALGLLNPFIGGVATGGVSRAGRYLPETRILAPPESDLYSDAGRTQEILNYLGYPRRRLK